MAEPPCQVSRWDCPMSFDVPALVSRLSRGRVLVVGDVILDRHVRGRVERVSPEAPIQVLTLGAGTGHEEDSPGGAANVACKIAELGGQAILAGVVGGRDDSPDEDGRQPHWGRYLAEHVNKNGQA